MNRHTVRQRLIFLLIMPLASLLYLGGSLLAERHRQAQDLQRVSHLVQLAVRAGELLHQVQRERGLSAGFLGSRGEEGFRGRLMAGRQETDAALARLRAMGQADGAAALGAGLQRRLAEVDGGLGQIVARRAAVDRMAVTGPEVVAYYTETNKRILALVTDITRESNALEIRDRGAAYVAFMRAKETAGIERAILSNAFAAGSFGSGMYARLLGLVALQDDHLSTFRVYGGPQVWGRLEQAMQGDFVEATRRFRQAALDSGGGSVAGLDAKQWFARQTEKIDAMATVEAWLAGDILARADALCREARRALLLALLGIALVMALTLGLAALVVRSIVRPLGRAVEVLGAMAEGDFTNRLEMSGRDEVASMAGSLDHAVHAINQALGEVRGAAGSVTDAASQISTASEDMSAGAQQQASSLEQTAATLEQITATVRQNSSNAMLANQLALSSQDVATRGGQVVAEAMQAMAEISGASKRIADIIATVDEIAFQTNLLALNAAVEAARAGEQGRGFAVVAGEVRELARRSSAAAREIKTLIADSVDKVGVGTQLVNRSGAMLEEIVAAVKRGSDIVGEIASASKEQALAIEQVNKAVSQMDRVTQAAAARNEQLSGTAAAMADQARALRALVARFRLDQTGAGEHVHAPPRRGHEGPAEPAAGWARTGRPAPGLDARSARQAAIGPRSSTDTRSP
jgi:methyl-accepting chemotaxis protein